MKEHKRHNLAKRVCTVLLSLSMIVNNTGFTAYAQEGTDELLPGNTNESTDTFGALNDGHYTLESKTYTLADDINTAGYIYIPAGVTATIDLNGHTIDRGLTSADNNGSVIIVAGTLTVTDSSTGGKIQGGYDGGNKAQFISGVEVQNGATFNLQGGTLIGRNQEYDSTVLVNDTGSFTMTDGKITGGWGGVDAAGNVAISGGEISGNNMYGVMLATDDFSVSGNPVITGNTQANVRFWGSWLVINVVGALTEGANIGITPPHPTDSAPVTLTSGYGTHNTAAPGTYFTLDNNGQIQTGQTTYRTVFLDWNENGTEIAVGTALRTVTFDMNGHGDAIEAVSLLSGYKVSEPTAPTADDWDFGGWFTDAGCTPGNKYDFDNAVTSDLTLHALWTQGTVYQFTLPDKMVIVSRTNTLVGNGYPAGTVIKFKAAPDYVVDGDVSDGTNTLSADGDGIYTVTITDADIMITATLKKTVEPNKTLSGSESYTANDGAVLTGSTSGTVTIANNAKITLSDVTITGGIVCSGTAEITLVGTNSVTGATNMAGIQVGGSGTTLTIKGNGSLTANGGNQSAGIGLSRAWDVDATGGDIVIEGGTITANGSVNGQWGAGIGTGVIYGGKTARLGDITIKGGTVTANEGTNANGIGTGYCYSGNTNEIGRVIIYDGINKVDASSINNSESIVFMHDETDVTVSKSDYFTIIEDGNRRVIAPKDDTDYTITVADNIEHGTLTGAATAKYGDQITITAAPDFGYRLSRLVVKDAQNNDVASRGNSFIMPQSNVTVSAVFEQGTHGTTEFKWYNEYVEETIYDGVTTVSLMPSRTYEIRKYEGNYISGWFYLDNYTDPITIPYSGGTGTFKQNISCFHTHVDSESGFYDITMADVGNGKWRVSIQKTVPVIDDIPDQTYTGSEITPEPLVLAGSLNLTKGTDYVYSYTNNTDAGTATVRATFQGDYASLGYVEKEFNITQANSSAPTFSGHGLLLTGQIGVEFLIRLPEGIDAQDTYMTFAGNHMDSNYRATAQATGDGRYQYIVFIPAYQMADQITPTLHYMDGSEEKTVVGEAYSAEKYIAWGLEDGHLTGDALNVVRALADYGYYSQFYLSRVNGWTRGTDYAAMTTKYSDSFDYNATYSALSAYAVDSDIADLSYRLNFGSTTRLDIRFTAGEGETVKLDSATVTPSVSEGYSTVSVSGIQASQLTTGHQLRVGDKTVTISPMSYARTLLGREGEADDLKNLLCAFYDYGNACAAYNSN